MAQPNFYAAVYAVIKNENWAILFWRRKNSWFKDGFLQLPAGHIEGDETMKAAVIREIKEEVNLEVCEENIEILHISHRVCPDRVYFDVYLEIKKYAWELKINEPDKCSELTFIDIDDLPKDDFVMYDIELIQQAQKWIAFSDITYT